MSMVVVAIGITVPARALPLLDVAIASLPVPQRFRRTTPALELGSVSCPRAGWASVNADEGSHALLHAHRHNDVPACTDTTPSGHANVTGRQWSDGKVLLCERASCRGSMIH